MKTKLKCKKNLKHQDGTQSFTKGMIYVCDFQIESPSPDACVMNNQNMPHQLGNWYKHFKIIES